MNRRHPADYEGRDEDRRQEARRQRLAEKEWRADIQTVMRDARVRRIVFTFLQSCGLDATPFNTNAMAQSHGIGMQDAARWWVEQIRAHCPEQEGVMRTENTKPRQPAAVEGEDDDH
jgi:hypothetical protein